MESVLDLKSKEEKDAELDRKIEALRKKNEALVRRHQMIEEDRRRAEQEGIAVTTPRKAKNPDGEPDKARKEKENFSITLDVSAGEKRVVNDGKSPKALHTPAHAIDTSPKSPTHRTSGRITAYSAGRISHVDKQGEPFKGEVEDTPPQDRSARGRRGHGPDAAKRSPPVPKDGYPGERWTPSPRGGRGPGRGGGTPGRGGGSSAAGDGAPAPDRKVKEWEEKRKLNIEKMNEEMEKIAEYERSQRDGVRDKNPIRNFLDDPRRTGPIMEADRKEGSRRHNRNWGGPDFERVKTGMDREKESHVRRPGPKNQMDMTISMTGKERAEYVRWKQERDQIDQERLARHRKPTGQWKREWDAEKTDSMFKEGAAPPIEEDHTSRRDPGKRGAPKPPTMAEFLTDGLKRPSQRSDQKRGRGRNKPYSMHDSRWEDDEEEEEEPDLKEKPLLAEEKETSVEKAKEQRVVKTPKKVVETPKKSPEVSAAAVDKKKGDRQNDADDGEEDDEEWTDASGVEEEDSSDVEEDVSDDEPPKPSPATPPAEKLPQPVEALKLIMPSPSDCADERVMQSKPASPFSPEGYRPVTDWGEEMELLSPPGSSNEDSPPQADNRRVYSIDSRSQQNFPPPGSPRESSLRPHKNSSLETTENLCLETPDNPSLETAENLSLKTPDNLSFETPEKLSLKTPDNPSLETPEKLSLEPVENPSLETSDNTSMNRPLEAVKNFTSNMDSETAQSSESKTTPEQMSPERLPAELEPVEAPVPAEDRDQGSAANYEKLTEEPIGEKTSPVCEEPAPITEESSALTEELEVAGRSVHIADYETIPEVPPSS